MTPEEIRATALREATIAMGWFLDTRTYTLVNNITNDELKAKVRELYTNDSKPVESAILEIAWEYEKYIKFGNPNVPSGPYLKDWGPRK